jgi:hypothetical protein
MSYYAGHSPSQGATVSASRPTITVTAVIDSSDIPVEYGYTLTKGATTVADSEQFTTEFSGSIGPVDYVFQTPVPLEDGVWTLVGYTKERDVNGVYNHMPGSPGAATTFTVSSVASVTLTSPVSDYVTSWSGTNHSLPVYWNYNTSSSLDSQTAYQVIVRRFDNATVVYDSGKVVSGNKSATAVIPAAQKDVQLEWSVRAWNANDVPTSYPAYRKVLIGTPPVSSISAPTQNQVLNGTYANVTTSATTSGGRTIKSVEASLWLGTTRLWTKTLTGTWASGATIQVQDNNYLVPQSTVPYEYRVTHTDSAGFKSNQVTRNFTVQYTPPAASGAPTLDNGVYDSQGYMLLEWDDTSIDADFYAWIIERTDAPLDPNTGLAGDFGPWNEVGRIYDLLTDYSYQDYVAPSNHYVAYRIKQVAIRFGVEMVGNPSPAVGGNAISTSYWLIAGVTGDTAIQGDIVPIRLYNVTGDTFTHEHVQNEYNLIGRGRYVEKGDRLGVKGSLDCQIRDGQGMTAREKRLIIENFRDDYIKAVLRNPFGDVITVSVGDVSVTRIPGTGMSEFVDLSIPYTEVS